MKPPFPSREELRSRGYSKETLDQIDHWRQGHLEAQKLAAKIPEVFGDPPRPRITLHVARGYDDEWLVSEARRLELTALDPEQHWTEVTAEAMQSFQEYFTFSDSEGWRFYLPAFMLHYLSGFPMERWGAVHFACLQKTHFDLLSSSQVALIEEFLVLCSTWED